MSEFKLANEIDSEKCFILHRSEIERRLDPFYYVPSIKELDKKIKARGAKPLRYFIDNISSGATPKTSEKEKYYSDKEHGIPFLRVQNLSPTGLLKLDNCKYINEVTHNSYLKRSQVEGGDLLVKITGVGRMAVASVAPNGFVGNTNQHMVVIKTKDTETSEILASYLNTDIGEKLATRRATGGTRPALDYPALLSIPIIFDDKILEIYKRAIKSKKQKEKQAKDLLDSIDDYLLDELSITLPKIDNSLEKRIFKIKLSDIENRLEPHYYIDYFKDLELSISNSRYPIQKLSYLCDLLNGYAFKSKDYISHSDTLNIRMSNIRPNNFFNPDYKIKYLPNTYAKLYKDYLLVNGDLIIAMTDMASEPKILGVPTIINNSNSRKLLLNQRVGKLFNFNLQLTTKNYLYNILGSKPLKDYYNQQGTRGVQINISREQILNAKIPLPPIEKQNEIAEHIQAIRDKAKQLKTEAIQDLENAKLEVQKMILGQ